MSFPNRIARFLLVNGGGTAWEYRDWPHARLVDNGYFSYAGSMDRGLGKALRTPSVSSNRLRMIYHIFLGGYVSSS